MRFFSAICAITFVFLNSDSLYAQGAQGSTESVPSQSSQPSAGAPAVPAQVPTSSGDEVLIDEVGGNDVQDDEEVEDVDEGEPVEVKPPPRARWKGGPREKNVQGTRALKSFEPETVIKSRYKRKGVPLDVDPD